ncbi:MAG: pyridoxamine 5'-phosphate oxidase family protein [Ferruginibacter sp.]
MMLFFSNKNNAEYLSIFGKASIVQDKQRARQILNPDARQLFEEGIHDPELTLLQVKPVNVHYWNTKKTKMIGLVKMMANAMTGKAMDENAQGYFKF